MTITIFLLVLAAACAAYGFMIMRIKSGATFYRMWYAIASICALLAIANAAGLLNAATSTLTLPTKLVFAIAFAAALIIFALVEYQIASKFEEKGEPNLDYLIILGAQVRPHGPSSALKKRLDTALDYLHENPETLAIVSGGQGPNEHISEAECMADYLIDNDIHPSRIIEEGKSTSTVQNLCYSGRICNPRADHVGIVTNNFHVFRSVQIAKRQGYRNVVGIAAPSDLKYLPNNMLREFFGIIKDTILGNMRF